MLPKYSEGTGKTWDQAIPNLFSHPAHHKMHLSRLVQLHKTPFGMVRLCVREALFPDVVATIISNIAGARGKGKTAG